MAVSHGLIGMRPDCGALEPSVMCPCGFGGVIAGGRVTRRCVVHLDFAG